MEGVREKYFSSGVSTNFHVETGGAATVIIERYRNDPHCLLAMATHGMSGLRRWLMGSVTSIIADGVIAQSTAQFNENIKSEAETYLDGKIQALRAEGLDNVISTAVLGDAATEIIDFAIRTENNLVAMSTHGRSGVGRWLLGSVAEKVVQHSQDPVLLIRVA